MMKNISMNRDIYVVIAITIVAVGLAFILPPDWLLGHIVALPLVLVFPGYALTAALFSRRKFEVPQQVAFSLAFSIVIVILGGLVLNLLPFGLQTDSWAALLGGIILGACLVALVRRRRDYTTAIGPLDTRQNGFNFRQGLLLGLAGLIVCGAVAVSIIGAQQQPYPGFTQLWMLQGGGANSKQTINLGVDNMEATPMEYRLAVSVAGKTVKEWASIDLNPNEKWEATLALPSTVYPGGSKIEADLYRAVAPTTIYRHVVLWLGT